MKRDSKTEGRKHRTRWSVRFADRFSAWCITVGGIGTILAVSAVFLFLASVVVPLFTRGKAKPKLEKPIALDAWNTPHSHGNPEYPGWHIGIDEYRVAAWTFDSDGAVRMFRADNGDSIVTLRAIGADSLSTASFDVASNSFALGLKDGSIRFVRLQFRTDYVDATVVPEAAQIESGSTIVTAGAIVQKTSDGSLRRQTPTLQIDAETKAVVRGAIRRIDHISNGSGYVAVAISDNDTVAVCRVEHDENEFTGEDSVVVHRGVLPVAGATEYVLVTDAGTSAYAVERNGEATVWDIRDVEAPAMVASADLAENDYRVTVVAPLLGRTTVLVGTDHGNVSTWFRYKPIGSRESRLANPRNFNGDDGVPVTAIAASARERVFLAGYGDGRVRVFHATSGKRVLDFQVGENSGFQEATVGNALGIRPAAFAPKSDGIVMLTGAASRFYSYDVDLKYPEVTMRALLGPVWYEGYPAPAHVWQSSAATDDFEPKLGMWPLVFGTIKATIYSMLFGVPLALLAAIFTSEFVSPGARPRLKTLIESMASLPSVVLGFLAALVIAPFVQRVVPSVMVAFIVVPGALLLTAYIWQLLPPLWARRMERFRFGIALAVLPLAIGAAAVMGPPMERAFFNGDLMGWLAGGEGGVWGGWFILALPVCAFVSVFLIARVTGTAMRDFAARSRRTRVATVDLGRFALGAVLTIGMAAAFAAIASAVGMDPRGSLMGTYVQRNALVVGFVMGFAIIPIIYTIAEDALSAVPDHLRAASLGAGATPWQTAIRIVLPTAMSGLFSAIMIGLGRAVGETMIVLMAAGNTPVLDLNAFSGFRTLSANIAVELPEAVRDSTHYRTLFLAALALFFMTFLINTVAEVVRLRFRKRSAQI